MQCLYLRKPATYRETFEILKEADFISVRQSELLSGLAGFRNVLVHIYWNLDIDEIYSVLQKDLEPLKEFKKTIKEILLKKE